MSALQKLEDIAPLVSVSGFVSFVSKMQIFYGQSATVSPSASSRAENLELIFLSSRRVRCVMGSALRSGAGVVIAGKLLVGTRGVNELE